MLLNAELHELLSKISAILMAVLSTTVTGILGSRWAVSQVESLKQLGYDDKDPIQSYTEEILLKC
jgi:hypothetical protein